MLSLCSVPLYLVTENLIDKEEHTDLKSEENKRFSRSVLQKEEIIIEEKIKDLITNNDEFN